MPVEQSDLAQAITKDPYNFDFLTLREKYDEKELKDALIQKVNTFLMELGTGFAYMGREVRIEVGDTVTKVNGKKVNTWDKLTLLMNLKNDKDYIEFEVKKQDGSIKTYKVTPVKETMEDGTERLVYGIGASSKVERGFLSSIKYAFTKLGSIVSSMFLIIGSLFTGKLSLNALSGPVGMYSVVKTAGSFEQLVYLMAYLSVNLAVVNAIPFPAFDGGRILFIVIEAIKGSKVKPEVENMFHTIGFILLMLLMVYITIQDIIRLF